MKLNSMVLSIDDRLPELTDFKRMIETGNSRFQKGTCLYVIEQQFEQECREYEAIMSCVDPDDRHFFEHMNPYRDLSFGTGEDNIDWDDPDLPF